MYRGPDTLRNYQFLHSKFLKAGNEDEIGFVIIRTSYRTNPSALFSMLTVRRVLSIMMSTTRSCLSLTFSFLSHCHLSSCFRRGTVATSCDIGEAASTGAFSKSKPLAAPIPVVIVDEECRPRSLIKRSSSALVFFEWDDTPLYHDAIFHRHPHGQHEFFSASSATHPHTCPLFLSSAYHHPFSSHL